MSAVITEPALCHVAEARVPCLQPGVSTWDAGCQHEHVTAGIAVCEEHEWRMTGRPWTCVVCADGDDPHKCPVLVTRRRAVILIDVVTNGESGFIVAVEVTDRDPGTGQDWDGMSTAVIVGQARVAGDGAKAWLWPYSGTYPGRGRSVHAVTAKTHSDLAAKLRKRHDEKGAWWQ